MQQESILSVHTPGSICFAFVNMPVQISSSAIVGTPPLLLKGGGGVQPSKN